MGGGGKKGWNGIEIVYGMWVVYICNKWEEGLIRGGMVNCLWVVVVMFSFYIGIVGWSVFVFE